MLYYLLLLRQRLLTKNQISLKHVRNLQSQKRVMGNAMESVCQKVFSCDVRVNGKHFSLIPVGYGSSTVLCQVNTITEVVHNNITCLRKEYSPNHNSS